MDDKFIEAMKLVEELRATGRPIYIDTSKWEVTRYNLSKVSTEQLQAELDKRKAEEQSEPVPLGPPCILRKW